MARKGAAGSPSRREQLAIDHLRAAVLSKVYPGLESLTIDLVFKDSNARNPPSAQMRTLFAAAPAFFRFPCPCADCDGDFDLGDAVASLVSSAGGSRPINASEGQVACQGIRFREHATLQAPCSLRLNFQLKIESQRKR